MSKILIGTTSYAYPDWAGTFYPPPETKMDDYLRYYTGQFPTVEINKNRRYMDRLFKAFDVIPSVSVVASSFSRGSCVP
jgi:hypothetical protein